MLTDFSPGNIDRYQIRSRLGGGGMGDLYLAWDPNTNRLVAIKLLNANLNSGDLRERFAREARALAALDNHPNIVVIHDYGDFQGSPYIVMEYVRGESLAEKIKRRAALTTAQKLKMMAELCAGLAHVHEVGIVHRDIKPANLMVEGRGRLKILDFGIARVAEGGLTRIGPQMTHVNMRIGTPGYMSPEQIDGRDIDHRSDLFAVGTVLYELLAYREAFTGKSTRQIENMVLEAQPKPLESLVHDIDPQIVAIVARALEKDPDHRFQTAEEFERALEEARSRLAPAITTPAPARQTPTPPGGAARGSRGARADAAYQRAVVVLQDGANDASRRFAIEALAEDPNHLGARALLDRLDPDAALWTPAASTPQSTLPPTSVASPNSGSPTIVRTQVSPAAAPAAERYRLLWTRYRIPAAIGASLVLAAGLVAGVVRATGWLSSGHSLSITKPSGGTITLRGQHITCGTFGSDCLATLPNNELVELEVQADPGFVFATYTGDCAPGGRTSMTAARTCGATFERVPAASAGPLQTLTITPPRNGTIVGESITCGTRGAECAAKLPQGSPVKLDVLPDGGYAFARFTGPCAPDGQTTMSEARTCSAVFAPVRQTAAVSKPDNAVVPTPTPALSPPPSSSSAASAAPAPAPVVVAPPPPANNAGGETLALGSRPNSGVPAGLPNTAPVAPPPDPEVTAKRKIEETLKEYCLAYQALTLEAIRRVFPSAPETLRDQLRQYHSVECTLTGPPEILRLDADAGTALVKVGVKQIFERKAGSAAKPQETVAEVALNRPQARGEWVILSMVHRPKR